MSKEKNLNEKPTKKDRLAEALRKNIKRRVESSIKKKSIPDKKISE